ncbi:hypothetical protein [Streptomyces beigongshangae]|uniref:hypothetical protein n=1 Tax=Streptomyces beigongshangae TaxID=2841597 RepID=UPI001C8515D3|nr:hypothetical protein [Streptomyces sp. REN17]
MSSRTPHGARRVARDAAPCSAPAVLLAVLVAVLVACPVYVSAHDRTAPDPAPVPVAAVSVAHDRLGSPAEHDRCCGLPTREARAVLPAGAHPLPAVAPRMPYAARPAAVPYLPVRPPTHRAPDLHVLQVQRI